jgi:UbiD family decarboxylase
LGRCYKIEKFHATAITHRKDRPIFFTPLAHSLDADYIAAPFREACFYELAQRVAPGLVIDVNTLKGAAAWSGHIIFQVKKLRSRDEGLQRNVLMAALGSAQALRLAIVVDEDVDIYSADDIVWALNTRVNPRRDIIVGGGGGMGHIFMPAEREGKNVFTFEGGMAIDATVPFAAKSLYSRPKHPVHLINLNKWLSEADIASMKARQPEYGRVLSKHGW